MRVPKHTKTIQGLRIKIESHIIIFFKFELKKIIQYFSASSFCLGSQGWELAMLCILLVRPGTPNVLHGKIGKSLQQKQRVDLFSWFWWP